MLPRCRSPLLSSGRNAHLLCWQPRHRENHPLSLRLTEVSAADDKRGGSRRPGRDGDLLRCHAHQHQQINNRWQDGQIIVNPDINICLAVAVSDGLITPVIHKADTLNIGQIATRRRHLVEQARGGTLQPADLTGGTFTISNLGMYSIDAFIAIINPPQAAILAVGRLAERVVPVDGMAAVRLQMTLSLSCDHRVIDGMRGAQFLATLAELIAEPLNLLT